MKNPDVFAATVLTVIALLYTAAAITAPKKKESPAEQRAVTPGFILIEDEKSKKKIAVNIAHIVKIEEHKEDKKNYVMVRTTMYLFKVEADYLDFIDDVKTAVRGY